MERVNFVIFLAFFLASLVQAIEFQTPEYILPCNKTDPNLDACILQSFNHLRPYLIRGIPELNVPSIEPLVVPRLVMENNAGAVRVRALFVNTTVVGPSNYSLNSVSADIENWKIQLGITIPRVEMRGKYEVIGQVLLFPVRSQGDFWAAFGDISGVALITGKIVQNKEGIRFMKIDKINIDFKLQKSKFKIRDTMNYNNVIGQAMNQFLNTNANEIIEEMKPAASTSIARHFKQLLNGAFLKIPLEIWLHGA